MAEDSGSGKGGGKKASRSAVDRVASRAEKDTLSRRSMPGGGEVFSGGLASRALKTLGARAMTVDKSIIVGDGFDASKPQDAALYAHEQYHLEHSGGEDTHGVRDGEEVAARAVERMVLHRHTAGGVESHEATHAVGSGAFGGSTGRGTPNEGRARGEGQPNGRRGYQILKAQGYAHNDIIDRLAREVIQALDNNRDAKLDRMGDKKSFL